MKMLNKKGQNIQLSRGKLCLLFFLLFPANLFVRRVNWFYFWDLDLRFWRQVFMMIGICKEGYTWMIGM